MVGGAHGQLAASPGDVRAPTVIVQRIRHPLQIIESHALLDAMALKV